MGLRKILDKKIIGLLGKKLTTNYKVCKMHKIRFLLELRLRPHWGAYSAPPDP